MTTPKTVPELVFAEIEALEIVDHLAATVEAEAPLVETTDPLQETSVMTAPVLSLVTAGGPLPGCTAQAAVGEAEETAETGDETDHHRVEDPLLPYVDGTVGTDEARHQGDFVVVGLPRGVGKEAVPPHRTLLVTGDDVVGLLRRLGRLVGVEVVVGVGVEAEAEESDR